MRAIRFVPLQYFSALTDEETEEFLKQQKRKVAAKVNLCVL